MPEMQRVRLLHWKAQEAAGHRNALEGAGYQVEYDEQFRPALWKNWREFPPDAFVIDLSRLPSHGRELAIALRQSPRTRLIPIVFCGGPKDKVSAIRSLLPDAAYCQLDTLAVTLGQALKERLANPVQPAGLMDRYSGRTAAQKLGITRSATIALVDAPPHALKLLGELPSQIEVLEEWTPAVSVLLCFLHQPHLVGAMISQLRRHAAECKLWLYGVRAVGRRAVMLQRG